MKLKLFDINRAQPAFQKILTKELPVLTAFKISRMFKRVQDVFEDLEAQRNTLVKKYGAPIPTGEYQVAAEHIDTFKNEFGELLQEDIDIDIEPLPLQALSGDLKLSALDLLALEPFLVMSEESQ